MKELLLEISNPECERLLREWIGTLVSDVGETGSFNKKYRWELTHQDFGRMSNYGRILFYGNNKFIYSSPGSNVLQVVYFKYVEKRIRIDNFNYADLRGRVYCYQNIFHNFFKDIDISPDKQVCNLHIGAYQEFFYACHTSPFTRKYHEDLPHVFQSLERVVNGLCDISKQICDRANALTLKNNKVLYNLGLMRPQICFRDSRDIIWDLWGGKQVSEVGA